MTQEELDKMLFSLTAHVSWEHEHTLTYASGDGRLGFCDHVPYRNGRPCGKAYRHYRIENQIYKTKETFLEGLARWNP